jgi:glutamate carboxypeptidase
MVALLRDLVAIESPTTESEAVAALARRLAAEAEALGLSPELVAVPDSGPLFRARSRTAGKPVMLLGHLDTVWSLGTLAAQPCRVEGDRLFGPGSYDMKGGLVVALFAVRALLRRGELPALTLFFTPREEVDCEPYRAVMDAEMKASAAVLDFEPAGPGGAVKTQRKGSGSFLLRAHGRAAHAGAEADLGRNAILELARQALDVSALADAKRGISVNVGVIRGGRRSNVVPDLAEAEVDFRVRTMGDGRQIQAAFQALRSFDPDIRLEVEGGLHYPPLERGPHVLAVYDQARQVAREMGSDLAEASTGGARRARARAHLLATRTRGPDGGADRAAIPNRTRGVVVGGGDQRPDKKKARWTTSCPAGPVSAFAPSQVI